MEQDINNLIEELTNVRPNELSAEGLKLFNKINEIIDKNKELEEKNKKKSIEIICYQEELENSIPVSLVEEKIEELNKLLEEDLQDERKINSNRFIIICQCKSCLQELLEKEEIGMSYKYLYEKDYKDKSDITRKLFNTSDELFNYLLKEGEINFNAGYHSAEIRLNRIEVED